MNRTSRPAAVPIGAARLANDPPSSRISCCRWRAVLSSQGKDTAREVSSKATCCSGEPHAAIVATAASSTRQPSVA